MYTSFTLQVWRNIHMTQTAGLQTNNIHVYDMVAMKDFKYMYKAQIQVPI